MTKILDYYTQNYNNITIGIDTSIANVSDIETYRYYKPLIYQKLPETQNQKEGWDNQIGSFLGFISRFFIKLVGLNKNLEPGYTILYLLPYILYGIIFILLFFIIRFIYKKCTKSHKKLNSAIKI